MFAYADLKIGKFSDGLAQTFSSQQVYPCPSYNH